MSLINTTVGNYKVTKLLGEGGMGMVYLGEHPVIGRKVAIKVLHAALAADKDIVSRFFTEARAIHMIGHPNIVEILDFGATPDGQPYFIMEYLTGEALSERVARGPMSGEEVGPIADQMCRALAAAHAKGIVHRDLKPHNIQILERDGALLVKILDFGVAKILAAPDGSESVKTRTGSLMGTPLYMSPEQCKGAGLLDHRTDIYSLGVMLFEMLAGRPPFLAEGIGELFAMHMLEPAPNLLDFAPQTPPAMAAAVMKALNKELDDRFPSMEEFRRAFLGEVAIAPTAARATSIKKPGMRSMPGVQVSPQAQSTTLSSATSEIDDEFGPPKRKTGLIVGAVVALAAIGGVAFIATSKKSSSTQGSGPIANVSTQTTPPGTTPPAPPTPAAPTTVKIRLEAIPPGVHVFRKADNTDLGTAPFERQLPRNGPAVLYVLRKDGYKDLDVGTDLASDHTLHVALEKVAEAMGDKDDKGDKGEPQKKKAGAGGGHHVAKHKGGSPAPDEDGLATPSF